MTENVLKKIARLIKPGSSSKEAANRGERMAAEFLSKAGFKILETNFRCKYGEIDIICLRDGIFCFVEVKSRTSFSYGLPEEFVDFRKRKKLTLTALKYIKDRRIETSPMRFDVVSIDLSSGKVKLIEGAFEAAFQNF